MILLLLTKILQHHIEFQVFLTFDESCPFRYKYSALPSQLDPYKTKKNRVPYSACVRSPASVRRLRDLNE